MTSLLVIRSLLNLKLNLPFIHRLFTKHIGLPARLKEEFVVKYRPLKAESQACTKLGRIDVAFFSTKKWI